MRHSKINARTCIAALLMSAIATSAYSTCATRGSSDNQSVGKNFYMVTIRNNATDGHQHYSCDGSKFTTIKHGRSEVWYIKEGTEVTVKSEKYGKKTKATIRVQCILSCIDGGMGIPGITCSGCL